MQCTFVDAIVTVIDFMLEMQKVKDYGFVVGSG